MVTLILTGIVHYSKLNVDDAVAFALRSIGIGWAANYVSLVAIFTLITGMYFHDLRLVTNDL